MLIAKIENGQVVNLIDHRQAFSGTPSDDQLAQLSYMKVNVWRDHDSMSQKLESCPPTIDGNWVYTVCVKDMTSEEIQASKDAAMAQIRAERNLLLANSDYTQIPDNPSPKKAAWATYRQALRDLPANVTGDPRTFKDFPKNPDWKPIPGMGE